MLCKYCSFLFQRELAHGREHLGNSSICIKHWVFPVTFFVILCNSSSILNYQDRYFYIGNYFQKSCVHTSINTHTKPWMISGRNSQNIQRKQPIYYFNDFASSDQSYSLSVWPRGGNSNNPRSLAVALPWKNKYLLLKKWKNQ